MLNSKDPLEVLLVLDFEATCEENKPNYTHEIIEFPIIQLFIPSLEFGEEFHCYVKPTLNPILSPFCTQLTGIQQV